MCGSRLVVIALLLSLSPSAARAQQASTQVTAPAPLLVSGEPGRGVTVTTADQRLSTTVRGRMQARTTAQEVRGDTQQLTQIKTVRLYVQGHVLWPDLKYAIQLAFGAGDFEAGSASPIFDAFIEHTYLRDLNVKVGQYFVPFDRARTVREFGLQLVDRPVLIPELTLDRDVGITLSSSDLFGLGGTLYYALSLFGGDGRNRTDASDPGLLYVARVAVTPFGTFDDNSEGDLERRHQPRLMIGIASAYNHQTDRQRSTTGDRFVFGRFNYLHGAMDLVFKYAGFSFMSEAVARKATSDARSGVDSSGMMLTERSQSGWGYLLQSGMMLTDQIEIAGRWGHMSAFANTDAALKTLVAERGHEATFGSNYYLNGHYFKFQLDFGLRWGRWSDAKEYVARLQLDASF